MKIRFQWPIRIERDAAEIDADDSDSMWAVQRMPLTDGGTVNIPYFKSVTAASIVRDESSNNFHPRGGYWSHEAARLVGTPLQDNVDDK